ncbi:hypothetical protein CAEBREN_24612 [Caenorhabditis brenneri]|uniref:F-box domain-containing protein n=1 Tax=Caenorhabditis brenneri TaxID=135651 RepID=G0NQQ3_CAEBE|nr:hypothetical protein CAEBREN_24612 [Caenorhabditis brenneri]
MDQLLGKINLNESREINQPPMLMDMPKVVMKLIMEKTDFRSLQTLRKVCHSLRAFIDDIHPEAHIDVIGITMELNAISLFFKEIHVEYRRHEENSCSISCDNKLKIFEDTNYIDRFSMDFELILRNQNSILNLFQVSLSRVEIEDVDEIFRKMKHVLKSKKLPLKTKEVRFSIENHENVLSILPYLDPEYLKNLVINDSTICDRDLEILEIGGIMELEQWKNLDEIYIPTFRLRGSIKDFEYCSRMVASLENVRIEELMELKKTSRFPFG